MNVERELKLLPNIKVKIDEILEFLSNNGYEVLEDTRKTAQQKDTYFDDEKSTLEKNEYSFRVRQTAKKSVITCKIPMTSNAGYKQRREFELDVPTEYLNEDNTIKPEYADENGILKVEYACKILKEAHPEMLLPEGMRNKLLILNNRNKVNIKSKDGTIIELAFDDLEAYDARGNKFSMRDEIEFELIGENGNSNNLEKIRDLIQKNYDMTPNDLSKYKRAIKEIRTQKNNMSLNEITLCVILSEVLKSKEFEQLKYKGQILHDYRLETLTNLDNFKDVSYLISQISKVKRTKNYSPEQIDTLEDMFLCFFSDMPYEKLESEVSKFLNEKFYKKGIAVSNRMSHSQQVMLCTGLICKSKEVKATSDETLLCMISALSHDIGHVPLAHNMERVLNNVDGLFSHEANGRLVLRKIVERNEDDITGEIGKYYRELASDKDKKEIANSTEENKKKIMKAIAAHSRTNSETREEGMHVQIPREADKIAYSISDIVDILKRGHIIDFFSEEWKNDVFESLSMGYEFRDEKIKGKITRIADLANQSKYGEIFTNIASSVRQTPHGSIIYYDVDQDLWNIMLSMIKNVKTLRENKVVDNKKKEMMYIAAAITTVKFNNYLEECNGNSEEAWEKTIEEITTMNDKEALKEAKNIIMRLGKQFDGDYILANTGNLFDTSALRKLGNLSDKQLKIKLYDGLSAESILKKLGILNGSSHVSSIVDTYYNSNKENHSIYTRIIDDSDDIELIVKTLPNDKNISQIERKRYSIKGKKTDTLASLIEKFNIEYPGMRMEMPNAEKFKIETTRTEYYREYDDEEITISKDQSNVIVDGKTISLGDELEIKAPDLTASKKLKKKLNSILKGISGDAYRMFYKKESKEQQAEKIITNGPEGR